MNYWVYVALGFIVTTLVIGTYWIWVSVRLRRASALIDRLEDDV